MGFKLTQSTQKQTQPGYGGELSADLLERICSACSAFDPGICLSPKQQARAQICMMMHKQNTNKT